MRHAIETHFRLRRPCKNCPFLREGAIVLAPGRLEGIIKNLIDDDYSTFQCHKTVHNNKTGGEWDDEGIYHASGQESMCVGAMIYLEKVGRPTVAMRMARAFGVYDPKLLLDSFGAVINPTTDGAFPAPEQDEKYFVATRSVES